MLLDEAIDLYLLTPIAPDSTDLPFWAWASINDLVHEPVIWFSREQTWDGRAREAVRVMIATQDVSGMPVTSDEKRALRSFVERHAETLLAHWYKDLNSVELMLRFRH